MPHKLPRPCRTPGCPKVTLDRSGYCEAHKQEQQRAYDKVRGGATIRGYGSRWRRARRSFLRENPLCVYCLSIGIIREATVVDHSIPKTPDDPTFWDITNWQALCIPCHNAKTGGGRVGSID